MSASNELRFILRDGKRILQQKHWLSIMFDPKDPNPPIKPGEQWPTEWRDVPLVEEEKQDGPN